MRCLLSALLGVAGVAAPLAAQLPQRTFEDEVVVTASLEEEERDDLSVLVDVVEAEEIEARQATSIAELLATLPGLDVVRSGSPGQVTSLFVRGTESDHTLVLWNGLELNNPYFGGFNWAFLPVEGARRIEVVRGPFSALYGSDALGGVVQVLSAPGDGVGLGLESGGDGYRRAAATGSAAAGRFRFDFAGHLRRGDGPLGNDFYDSEELVARAGWTLGPGARVGLVARVNDSATGIPFSAGTATPRRRIEWRERELAVPLAARAGRWEVDAQLSWIAYESLFSDPEDAFGFTRSETDSRSVRARTVASRRFGEEAWLALGGEVERLEVDDRSVFGVSLDGAEQRTWAAFGQLMLPLGAARLELGLRHDDNDVFGGQTSPKLGLMLPLGRSMRLRAAYGEGFRAPSIGELFYPFSGNRELRPERSESFELSLERRVGVWRWSVAGFENRLSDLIDFDFVTFRNFNLGRARTRGVEVTAGWTGERHAVTWNATWLDAVDRDSGLPLLRRPERSTNLIVVLRPGDWSLSATGAYVGERPDVDPATFARAVNPSHVRFDLAARWRLSDRFAPYARIENVADRDYAEALGFPAPGRTLIVGLHLQAR